MPDRADGATGAVWSQGLRPSEGNRLVHHDGVSNQRQGRV